MSSIYKVFSKYKFGEYFFIGFNRCLCERQDEVFNNTEVKGNCHTEISSEGVFVFIEYQQNATYGLGQRTLLKKK